MEPISINLGVLIPEKDIIRRARDLCRRYGTLFIADEVACGFGRTGRVFACEHFDLEPDTVRGEGDERRAGAHWRGDRNRADRAVDGVDRRSVLLDVRLAPAQRRRSNRHAARPQGQPAPVAR